MPPVISLSGDCTTTTISSSLWKWNGKLTKNSKLLILSISSLFLVAAIIAIVAVTTHHSTISTASHAILRASCATTRFPDLCHSSISNSPSLLRSISSHKDVILASLNLTETAVSHSVHHVHSLAAANSLTVRERTALADCLDMFSESLDELRRTTADLSLLPAGKQPPPTTAEELEILVSAAMTNQQSCLDGFSHDQVDRHLRESLLAELTHVTHMCSNSLAMIKDMTASGEGGRRRNTMGIGRVGQDGWPEWMGKGERRRMEEDDVKADVVVAADGSGNYRTISEAVAAAPVKSTKRYVIRIKAGTYEENVEVPKKKTNIMFVGDGRNTTVITGSRNVVDGSTTFKSATLGQSSVTLWGVHNIYIFIVLPLLCCFGKIDIDTTYTDNL